MQTSLPSWSRQDNAAQPLPAQAGPPAPPREAWAVPELAAGLPTRVHPDIALLRRAFAPAQPSEATLERLRTHSLVVRHGIGNLELAGPAHPVPAWWLLRRGRMSLGWQDEAGAFTARHLIGLGDWLDVAGAMSEAPAWVDAAQCRTPVELLALPLRTLFEACAVDPELMRAVGQLLAGRVRTLSDTLHDVITADVPARLARWLLRRAGGVQRAADAEEDAPRLVLTELKQAIAAQLGTSSETFSRALRRLADAGIVKVQGYELTLLDLPALHAIAHPAQRGGSARQSFAGGRAQRALAG